MSDDVHKCPKCECPYGYFDGSLWVCPECFHEWSLESDPLEASRGRFCDINGNELKNGDTVITVKDLKVGKDKVKSGTKVKNIRLLDDPVNGHDISCKLDKYGSFYLKCSVVKKA